MTSLTNVTQNILFFSKIIIIIIIKWNSSMKKYERSSQMAYCMEQTSKEYNIIIREWNYYHCSFFTWHLEFPSCLLLIYFNIIKFFSQKNKNKNKEKEKEKDNSFSLSLVGVFSLGTR